MMKSSINYILGILALTTGLLPFAEHRTEQLEYSGKPVVSHVLDVDMNDPRAEVKHGFSFGLLYGFETTSEIAADEGVVAAVNGMFYDALGMPIGLMMEEGQPIRIQDTGGPAVLIDTDNHVTFSEVTPKVTVYVGEGYTWLYSVNGATPNDHWGLYTPVYGSTTRISRPSVNYKIKDDVVEEVVISDSPVAIEGWDMILTYAGEQVHFAVGDQVRIETDLGIETGDIKTAFQGGNWIVKDGVNVAEAYDSFLGYTTAPQPRTLVGMTEDNHLIFVVVDGRQSDYSLGVSGYDAGELMLSYGCVNAAYLDGGASSTMIYEGEMVNRPSGEKERAVAHALLIVE